MHGAGYVVRNLHRINIQKKELPEGIKEGSILTYRDGKYSINIEKEKKVSDRIKEKMDKLWND